MKCLSLALSLLAVLGAAPAARAQAVSEETARVIVRFKPAADSVRARALSARATRAEALDVAQTRATALGQRTGRQLRARQSLDARTHVITATGQTSAALAKRLAQDSEVELVAVDERRRHYVVPNDPLYATGNALPVAGQWYLKAPAGDVVSSINAPAAWDITKGSAGIIVAVLDTGVRKDHPDLAAQIVGGYDMVGLSSDSPEALATANDGDRADADASDPGDWVSRSDIDAGSLGSSCTVEDIGNSSWHGTRVSGLIGATSDNGLGIAGVGWGIKILPMRVLGKCGGYDSDIIAAMRWAAGIAVPGLPSNPNVAKVLNMSLGGSGSCGATTDTGKLYREVIGEVTTAGATIVVAAGNSTGEAVGVPGNCPGVITVAGLRHAGSKVGYSSVGPEVSIAAPGGNCVSPGDNPCLYPMLSTTNSGRTTPTVADNAYTDNSASVGTSFSTPLVSGVVALMLSARPGLTPAEIKTMLQSTARPFVSTGGSSGTVQCRPPSTTEQLECYCTTSTCGAGMLDAAAAVAAAKASNPEQLQITVSPSGATAGQTITLSAAGSTLAGGRAIASAAWTLVDGGSIVSGFASASNTISTTVIPAAAGSFTVRVQLTDELGTVHATTSTIVVAAAPVTTNPSTSSSSGGGGGGGAFSLVWLLALGGASLALRRGAR